MWAGIPASRVTKVFKSPKKFLVGHVLPPAIKNSMQAHKSRSCQDTKVLNQVGDTTDCKSTTGVSNQNDFITCFVVETDEVVCCYDIGSDAYKIR